MGTFDAFVTKLSNLLPPQVRDSRRSRCAASPCVLASNHVVDFNYGMRPPVLVPGASWSPVLQVPQVVGDQNVLVLNVTEC